MNGATVAHRDSVDFLIDGESLLARLVEGYGGHGDFMGCLVHGFPDAIAEAVSELLLEAGIVPSSRRVGIYICPECGDIGCGRFSVKVERYGDQVVWSEFSYENGYEEPWVFEGLGPFRFESSQYEHAVHQAAEI
jgi:hypothetical protein